MLYGEKGYHKINIQIGIRCCFGRSCNYAITYMRKTAICAVQNNELLASDGYDYNNDDADTTMTT